MMGVAWYKEIPDDQKISYAVTPRSGAMLRAKMLGGQLRVLARLMTAMGDDSGVHMETFVADIRMDDDGTVRFDLAVMPKAPDEEDIEAEA